MKKGKNILIGLLITVFVAGIMAVSMVLGYRFLRSFNQKAAENIDNVVQTAKEKTEETLDDIIPDGESYTGPRLYESRGYIYNDAGDILDDFHVIRSPGLDILFDVNRKYGVFISNSKCYLVRADLTYEQIADKCSEAVISYDGSQVFYRSSSDGLWLYNTENGKKTSISEEGKHLCISPNGKTVAYSGHSDYSQNAILAGGSGEKKKVVAISDKASLEPVAISNDGKTVFYQRLEVTGNSFMCYDKGKTYQLSTKEGRNMFFDRSCKKVVFKGRHGVYYFDADSGEQVQLVDVDEYSETNIVDTAVAYTDSRRETGIVAIDNLSKAVVINTISETYCMSKDCESAVLLCNDGYPSEYSKTKDGIACLFKLDDRIYRSAYENGSVSEELLFRDVSALDNIAYQTKFNEGFISKFEDSKNGYIYKLYYFHEGEEDRFITDLGKTDGFMVGDDIFRKCYCLADGELIRINWDQYEKETIVTGVEKYSLHSAGDGAVGFKDNKGNGFIVINDNVLPE